MDEKSRGEKTDFAILTGIDLVLCLVLTVGVMTLFRACGPRADGMWMSCHYAQLTVFGLGLAMTALSLLALLVKKARRLFEFLTIVCAAAAGVIPGNVIRLCMMNGMRCRAVMRPFVILMSILIIVVSVCGIASGKSKTSTER